LKKYIKYILVIVVLFVAGAWIFWQYNKKKIVRNALENMVSGKTDSLYYIHYDSSSIDEINGNASFYNIALQSDSLQQQLLQFDSVTANSIYNIHIAEVSIRGANIPALLSNEKVEANSIKIIRPLIYIIESGNKKKEPLDHNDTLAIYEKLLGKFKSIKASEVIIEDGQLNIAYKANEPYVSLGGINISVKNILIDSTKNYDNLISYFIKDVDLHVNKAVISNPDNYSTSIFSSVEYNAAKKILGLKNFQQKNKEGKIVFDINNTTISGLNTDSFILKKQLKAGALISDGGLMTFYRKKTKESSNESIEIDNSFFDEALLDKITLNNTKIVVYNKDLPAEAPFILTNVKFDASAIQNLYSGTNIRNLVSRSNWNLSADGFSLHTKDKVYELNIGAFKISKATGLMHIDYFNVKPKMSEAAYISSLKEQKDLYDISIRNIDLSGIDTKKLLEEKMLIAEHVVLSPVIKIYNDRTIPAFTGNKIGNYPHQLIQKLKFPLYIKKIDVKDGYITYTERGQQSEQKGTVFFSRANGTIENVTNIPAYIKQHHLLVVKANARLLGVGNLQTKWSLPLDTKDGSFIISGYVGGFNASALNPLIEPLALASIKNGTIKSVDFTMEGNDNGAKGSSTLLYHDLKVEALKKDSGDLKKRGLLSFVANLIVKDDNPKNNIIRKGEIDLERDKTRSFFNLIWKGIFKAAKRTATGKNDEK
jgi:hypothetical protein